MASLKEIKGRIGSINGTLKITSAMKMVASAKLSKAQTEVGNLLPYQEKLDELMSRMVQAVENGSGEELADSPLLEQRPVNRAALVVFSSNSSLCGAFNSNVIRLYRETVGEYEDKGIYRHDLKVFGIGRKASDAISRDGFTSMGDFSRLADKHIYSEAVALADTLAGLYRTGKVDRVELIYSHFKSTSSQVPVRETYLPFSLGTPSGTGSLSGGGGWAPSGNGSLSGGGGWAPSGNGSLSGVGGAAPSASAAPLIDWIIEPSPAEMLKALLPNALTMKIYSTLLDSYAAEQAARTVAMQEATDNGQKLLQELTLQYNEQRQQAITNELLDIVAGTVD